jgi:hypothetical protein
VLRNRPRGYPEAAERGVIDRSHPVVPPASSLSRAVGRGPRRFGCRRLTDADEVGLRP